MDIGRYLGRLHGLAADYAVGALKRPATAVVAEYTIGWHCGFLAGLAQAEEELSKLINEENDREEAE